MIELDTLIAELKPEAEKVLDLETSKAALIKENGTLKVRSFFLCSL